MAQTITADVFGPDPPCHHCQLVQETVKRAATCGGSWLAHGIPDMGATSRLVHWNVIGLSVVTALLFSITFGLLQSTLTGCV